MNTKKSAMLLLFATLVVAFSCGKEGPRGPEGPRGDKGAVGPKGEKGDRGPRGTANVIYSGWINIGPGGWTIKNHFTAVQSVYDTKREDLFTQKIIDEGTVLVYFKSVLNYIFPLPFIWYGSSDGSIVQKLEYDVKVGYLNLRFYSFSGFDGSPYFGITIRYILIPGGVHARRSAPPPDYTDYHAVCAYYDIPE